MAAGMLANGSTGQRVEALQKSLIELGLNPGPVDGIFGSKTQRAVKAFQRREKLEIDGIVGPKTRAALTVRKKEAREKARAKAAQQAAKEKAAKQAAATAAKAAALKSAMAKKPTTAAKAAPKKAAPKKAAPKRAAPKTVKGAAAGTAKAIADAAKQAAKRR